MWRVAMGFVLGLKALFERRDTMSNGRLFKDTELRDMANAVRFLAIDAIEKAQSGHPGMPLGAADIATALFSSVINVNVGDTGWIDRDRFVLSAGHGSGMLYGVMNMMGYPGFGMDQVKNFRQMGANTSGHPEYGHGVDTTTGPLGNGIAMAVGMALAESMLRSRFGADYIDHYTYSVVGDGCMMEGISQEALELAGHFRLSRLIVLFDDNQVTIDGHTDLVSSTVNYKKRVEGAGWEYVEVNGQDAIEVIEALEAAKKSYKPTFIACKTTIGWGAYEMEDCPDCHGGALGPDLIARIRRGLGWTSPPFEVPAAIQGLWKKASERSASRYAEWKKRFDAMPADLRKKWDAQFSTDRSSYADLFAQAKKQIVEEKPELSTRESSHLVLNLIAEKMPFLLGGSADLTWACYTMGKGVRAITPTDKSGGYIHYGIREHAMGAIMNGLALHKGFLPIGSTLCCFIDYYKAAVRLSALMGVPGIQVLTHDSIGMGEDGPTHQPIEHLASLRAMPNCNVMRPADAMEMAECWEIAVATLDRPTMMFLSRQALPTLRDTVTKENLTARGAYVLAEADGGRKATIIATGSEVEIALGVQKTLKDKGIAVAVVSMPCWELFDAQPQDYRDAVLGSAPVFSIEAGATFGWERWTGSRDRVFGIDQFGYSAPFEKVYEKMGMTPAIIAQKMEKMLK